MRQSENIRFIKGVGPKAEEQFHKLGIYTVGDLLAHLPRDYDIFRPIQPISAAQEGEVIAVEGVLNERPKLKRFHHLKLVSAVFRDESSQILAVWFNMPFLMKQLRFGTSYILRGKVNRKNSGLLLEQPKIYSKTEFYSQVNKMQPIYPLTSGLTNRSVQKAVKYALQ